MSSHQEIQITQLRSKLQKQKQTIEQQREELEREKNYIVELTEDYENTKLQNKKLLAAIEEYEKKDFDEERKMGLGEQNEQAMAIQRDYKTLKAQYEQKLDESEKLQIQLEEEKSNCKMLKDRLRSTDPNLYKQEEIDMYENDKKKYQQELNKAREQITKMHSDLSNILAENRVLRKLAEVPDNYGFDLEQVQQAEKEKIEDYKKQVRYLEREVEELAKQQTALRARLRTTEQLKGGQFTMETEERELPGSRSQKDRLEKLLDKWENNDFSGGVSKEDNEKTQRAIEEMKREIKTYMDQMMNQTQAQFQQNNMEFEDTMYAKPRSQQQLIAGAGMYEQRQSTPYDFHSRPPTYLPGKFGDAGNITEGITNRFGAQPGQGQRIPVDMYDLYSESGFDQIVAKQEIATLQLMNLENIKIIQEKEREYATLYDEMSELREQYLKNLLIQDNLFDQHFSQKSELEAEQKRLIDKNNELINQISQLQMKIQSYEENLDDIKSRSAETLNGKLAAVTRAKAILEVNLIQISRKYDCLKDEYDDVVLKYQEVDKNFSEKEEKYIHRIQQLIEWKKRATSQLKILLHSQEHSVSEEQYKTLVEKYNIVKDKYADQTEKYIHLQKQLAELKGAQRELEEKQDQIHVYQEEIQEINVEMEIIKKRLEEVDPIFRKYQKCFNTLVKHCKENNFSPLEAFQQADKNKDGQLGKAEFNNLLNELKIHLEPGELSTIFMFMDLDGNNTIEYHEFVRRLQRAGVTIRRKEEEVIFSLYDKIKTAGWDLRNLFEALDRDGSNNITKDELAGGLSDIGIQVPQSTIDYVFNLADLSRDGQINFDEFRSMFENVLTDNIRQEISGGDTDLDPKKDIMLQIDHVIREMGYSLLDIYKIMDHDEDQQITVSEFKKLFKKLKVVLPDRDIEDLFDEIDKDGNRSIQYNELLAYMRQAKQDQAKIEKMRKINKRVESIKQQSDFQYNQEHEMGGEMGIQQRQQMKIQMLELREKNSQKKIESQKKKITLQSKELSLLEKKINDLEGDLISTNMKFYEVREKSAIYQEKIGTCIPQEKSDEINMQKQKLLIENGELKAALKTFKSLYLSSVEHIKVYKLTDEKRENQLKILTEMQKNIKDLQASSDDRALIGKLSHQLMICRWQQGEVNKKYDKVLDDTRQDRIQLENFESQVQEYEEDLGILHNEYFDYKKRKEIEVEDLKAKIIPTVSLHKIEELNNKYSEIVQQKIDLEITNRQLKEANNELQLNIDFYVTQQQTFDDIRKELEKNNVDSHQEKIIQQGLTISELKRSEMKAKREAGMAREKEEYYQRINRQHAETIKAMESEISENQVKFNEREEFWRKRAQQSEKLFFKKQDEKEKAKKQTQQSMEALAAKREGKSVTQLTPGDKQFIAIHDQSEVDAQRNSDKDKITSLEHDLRGEQEFIADLKDENRKLKDEIGRLQKEGGVVQGRQTRQTAQHKEDIDEMTKRAIDEESEKFTKVAQKTIQTLQQLIDEKNEHLEQRDRLIQKMKSDFIKEKEKDIQEIRTLSNQVAVGNMSSMQKMNASILQQNGQVIESSQYWGDVGQLLHEKDHKLQDLCDKLDDEAKMHKRTKNTLRELKEENQALRGEIEIEKKRNETGKLLKEVDKYKALLKAKETEFKNIKKMIEGLKEDQFKLAEEKYSYQSKHQKVVKEDKQKIQQIEQQLSDALKHVKSTQLQIQKNNSEIEELRQQGIKYKGRISELEEENKALKSGEYIQKKVQSRYSRDKGKEEESGAAKGGEEAKEAFNTKVKEQEKEIEKLVAENKELRDQLAFIKKQKSKDGLVDEDGNLEGKSMYFKSIQELMFAIREWSKQQTEGDDLLKFMRKYDTKKTGLIKLKDFYSALQEGGIKLKEKDQKLINDNSQLVNSKDQLSIVEFAYFMRPNLRHSDTATDEAELPKKGVTIASKEISSKFAPSRKETEDKKKEQTMQQLEKKINILNNELYKARKQNEDVEKQLRNWKDKAARLEKDLQTAVQNPTLTSTAKRASMTQANAVQELKDQIYSLEDKNEKLKMTMYEKEVKIQKLGEQKVKLEEELKGQRVDILKTREQLEKYMRSQIGVEQLKEEDKNNKEVLIRNLKLKLEQQRSKDEEITEKYFEVVTENKELKFIKDNFDIQVERLQRRIVELEEYKKLNVKDEPSSPLSNTLKKGPFQRRGM